MYGKGFSAEEKKSYIPILRSNIVTSMQQLGKASKDFGGLNAASQEANEQLQKIQDVDGFVYDNEAIGKCVDTMWADPAVQQAFLNRSKLQVVDSAEYLFNRCSVIMSNNFVPTLDDMLRARARTTGIFERKVTIDGQNYALLDVGGQRSEVCC